MANPDNMKKDELVVAVRKLTQELKKLMIENQELKEKTENVVVTKDALEFDSFAISFKCNSASDFEVHLVDYDTKGGQGVLKEKFKFDRRYQAEYKLKELLHYKVFKGGQK